MSSNNTPKGQRVGKMLSEAGFEPDMESLIVYTGPKVRTECWGITAIQNGKKVTICSSHTLTSLVRTGVSVDLNPNPNAYLPYDYIVTPKTVRPFLKYELNGMSLSPESTALRAAKARCNNPKSPAYKYYGGRGIKVCERWDLFANFYADMGPRPSPLHSLDRIDPNGNYELGNCRWATDKQQGANRRNVYKLEHKGMVMNAREWAMHLGFPIKLVDHRLRKGWSVERALDTPPRKDIRRDRNKAKQNESVL